MMLRLRRYRLVVVFVIVFVLAAYHFFLIGDSNEQFLNVKHGYKSQPPGKSEPEVHQQSPGPELSSTADSQFEQSPYTFPTVTITSKQTPKETEFPRVKTSENTEHINSIFTTNPSHKIISIEEPQQTSQTDFLSDTDPKPVKPPEPHWERLPENYPVPPELVIKLPTPNNTPLPRVQATFSDENDHTRGIRLKRRNAVRLAFVRSWDAYRKCAWGHDEVRPISCRTHDPFMGWGATLVDALDTLWIMGLKEEFEEAVNVVKNIDFTTSHSYRIPLFETTIRYLGGLLGAYDISQQEYPILLEKAVQLGDILYGAFDTPNRMPVLYYYWHPDQVKRPKQAGDSSIAEMGTLAMEFTRLAQLTGNSSYFDAIQRITNAFEEIQLRTSLPGMWPAMVDASGGCKPPPGPIKPHKKQSWSLESAKGKEIDSAIKPGGNHRRQFDDAVILSTTSKIVSESKLPGQMPPLCVPRGITSRRYGYDKYTFGGTADSFYEYLIKMHILLGGSTEQYKKMYVSAIEVGKKLFYRPMIADNADVLLSGDMTVSHGVESFETITGHLTCFMGGLMALGGRTLRQKTHVEVGRKLTEGCVWAYGQMRTGIMAEYSSLTKCEDLENCQWNEEKWLQGVEDASGWGSWGASRGGTEESTKRYPSGIPPGFTEIRDKRYLLRPEAIESVFVMYRITADTSWQEKGWKMFEATNKTTRTKFAYSAIDDVTGNPDDAENMQNDSMESFWLAETLKYYYLLFSEPELVSLDDYVFNTEAHPFLRPKPSMGSRGEHHHS